MGNTTKSIGEIFRTIIEPVIHEIAEEYSSIEGVRALIGNEHPKVPQSRAISSQRGQRSRKKIIYAVSITVYDETRITTVSVFYREGSEPIFVTKLGVIGSEQINLNDITKEILKAKVRQYLPKIS